MHPAWSRKLSLGPIVGSEKQKPQATSWPRTAKALQEQEQDAHRYRRGCTLAGHICTEVESFGKETLDPGTEPRPVPLQLGLEVKPHGRDKAPQVRRWNRGFPQQLPRCLTKAHGRELIPGCC